MKTKELSTYSAGRIVSLGACVLLGFTQIARAGNPAPICAVLFDEGDGKVISPIASILETGLPQEGVTLVERQRIDQVLKEQQLQAMLSPSAGSGREMLGTLLKADLLLMLRSEAKPTPRMSVVVCQTTLGLRLSVATVLLSGDAQRDALAIESLLNNGLAKYREKVTQVYAVPPFVSRDLTYESDYLKQAYARIIEQRLLQQSGVVVVETEEAQAVAREIALSNGPEVQRNPPIYFYGDYQHDSAAAASGDMTMHLTLAGRARAVTRSREKMSPSEASAFLNEAVDGLIEAPQPRRKVHPDSAQTQAVRLIARAQEFERIGDWQNADGLTEAALLLAPDIIEFHRREIVILTALVAQSWTPMREPTVESVRRAAGYYFRALAHLELFLRTAPNIRGYSAPDARNFVVSLLHSAGEWGRIGRPGQDVLDELQKNQTRTREVLLNIARMRARDGRGDEWLFFAYAVTPASRGEKYDVAYQMLNELQDLPGGSQRTYQFATFGYTPDILCTPEGRAFLERVINGLHNLEVVGEARTLRDSLPKFAADAARRSEELTEHFKGAPPDPGPQDVSFAPFALPIAEVNVPVDIEGYVAAGDIDVFWTHKRILVDRGGGKIQTLWTGVNGQLKPMRASYDGRYVWLAGWQDHQPPLLLVIDPASGRVWQLGAADGLPFEPEDTLPRSVPEQAVSAVGLSPGHACVAGYLGRSYLALVAFDPSAGAPQPASVKIFHEAKEPPDGADRDQWKRTTPAFVPGYMLKLVHRTTVDPGGPEERRILVGRSSAAGDVWYHPLLVDPDRLTVSVIADKVDPGPQSSFAVEDGVVYWAWSTLRNSSKTSTSPTLWRLGFPDFRKSVVAEHVYEGAAERFTVWLSPNRSIVVGDHLWVADRKPGDAPHGPFQPLRGTMADSFIIVAPQLVQTNYHGMLVRGERENWYRVSFLNGVAAPQSKPASQPSE